MKLLPTLVLLALVAGVAPPAAVAQRSSGSRGTAVRGGGESAGQTSSGPIQPGTPGSAYRSRPGLNPIAERGFRRNRLSYFWWNFAPFEDFDVIERPRPVEDIAPAPPRVQTPAESSLIQPMLTLPRPQIPQAARGTLHLDVQPTTAQVYVDGFYVGTVEEVSRVGNALDLAAGWHRLEFRAPGFLTPAVNVTIEANRTFNYRGELKPIVP